jgi:hypothetical protein
VSGDIGKTKASGNLFRHLLAQENVPASNIRHTGDNRHSDYAVPRKLGIQARLSSEASLSYAEMKVTQATQGFRAMPRLAGAMRAFRLKYKSGNTQDIIELASQFVAPFVMGFVTWVLQRAQKEGVKRLYFVSRDCQLAWKVARELSPQFGGIDCRYLYVSRQALFLPSTTAISPEGMPWMRRSIEEPVLKNLLAKIELTFEDVAPTLGKLAGKQGALFTLKSEQDWQQFWDALNEEPLKTRINELIGHRRKTANQYFQAAGLFDETSWAIVDFGWYLTGQQSLWKLLETWGWQRQIQGFYLALKCERVGYGLAGKSGALIYQTPSNNAAGLATSTIFSHQTLLEHIVGCADHPTVHHHEASDGRKPCPAYAGSVTQATLTFCQALHPAVLDFVAENQPLVEGFKDATFCREVLASLANSFFKFPTEKSAGALAGLSVAEDQNGLNAKPIVKRLNTGNALLLLLPRRRPFAALWKNRDFYWLEGSVAGSASHIRQWSIWIQGFTDFRARIRKAVGN